jgi:hypothetical protein
MQSDSDSESDSDSVVANEADPSTASDFRQPLNYQSVSGAGPFAAMNFVRQPNFQSEFGRSWSGCLPSWVSVDEFADEADPSTALDFEQPLNLQSESGPSRVSVDEFAPGSHPDIIKCYMYPPALAICPAKPESAEEGPSTPLIDPSIDTESPSYRSAPADIDLVTPDNAAIFTTVKDVTIPAGSSLPVGAEFTKTWSMEHLASGHEYKFDQLRLVHESGGLLGEACNIRVAYTQDDIKMGTKVEVSIAGLKVPDLPEQQVTEQWRFRDSDGTPYGEPLRLR